MMESEADKYLEEKEREKSKKRQIRILAFVAAMVFVIALCLLNADIFNIIKWLLIG